MNSRTSWLLGAGLLCMAGAVSAVEAQGVETQGLAGANPNPIHLVRPRAAPLSAMAQLGQQIFYDASLSSSGAPIMRVLSQPGPRLRTAKQTFRAAGRTAYESGRLPSAAFPDVFVSAA